MVLKYSNANHLLIHKFFNTYPGEGAVHLNNLPLDEVLRLLQSEPIETSTDVYLKLNPDVSSRLIEHMDEDFFTNLYTIIDPFRGVVLLARINKDEMENRLALLPKSLADEYRELMSYPPESAGHLMDPHVTAFFPNDKVEHVLKKIRVVGDVRIIDICVVDEEGNLIGVVPLQHIAIAQPEQQLSELIYRDPITVNMMDPREDVVTLLEERKLASLPVISLDGKLLCIIRHDALVSAAQQEVSQACHKEKRLRAHRQPRACP